MCEEQMIKEKREPYYTNDYLIVSHTKKAATYVYRQFRDYIVKHNIDGAFNNSSRTLLVSSNGFHGEIRFVSERDYLVASVGFHGWVMNGYDLERWLDAAEEYEREEENG